jgi:DNA primase catalytic core
MARIPQAEIERLKAEVSLVRLIEDAGVTLRRQGKDYVALCPFHAEETPSLTVTPAKNLFHCFGCGAAGGPIDWVMKKNGVSFRHAVELLREGLPAITEGVVKRSTVRALPPPVSPDADDQALLNQTIAYYHDTLKQAPEALAYLKARGLTHPELIDRFRLGYANRTLGLRLPQKTRKEGAEIRSRLERLGLYRESGHEHFNGSIVVPVLDEAGNVTEVYGRKVRDDLRPGTPKHLYLPGPHRGVWNLPGLAASGGEAILTEALIDAMTFWCAGYRNVTACYGVEGLTEDHLAAFQQHGVERVLIAFDRDAAGERGAEKVAETLMAAGIACYRIELPKGMDANAYALKVTPAAKSLGVLIRTAAWLGKGKPPKRTPLAVPAESAEPPAPSDATASKTVAQAKAAKEKAPAAAAEPPSSLAAESTAAEGESPSAVPAPAETPAGSSAPEAPPLPAARVPAAPSGIDAEVSEAEVLLSFAERRWRVRGLARNLAYDVLKVNLLASIGERFHVDTLDLYNARARASFLTQAAVELNTPEGILKTDLGRVLLKLEELQEAAIRKTLEPKPVEAEPMDEAERQAALALLQAPDLMARILADFEVCGIVGEATNKLVGYLAAVSRKLAGPLAVLIQSSSAAGKSALMEAILAFVPEEERVQYSAMTGQSLFYMGETNLKHRILAIAEEEGAHRAAYALKLLQSEGALTIASTGTDPKTGNLVTQEYRVEGPTMLMMTTTAIDIDEELMNRCLILSVDEDRAQTQAIHRLQREKRTLAGLVRRHEREAVLALHRNAQRLLRPLAVVNPYADRLTFLDDRTRTRRDHEKYLTLIDAITLLHQHQRPVRSTVVDGTTVEYVETTLADIEAANALAHEVLGRSLDELPPQTRRILGAVVEHVQQQMREQSIPRSAVRFTRKDIRARTGWGDTQLKLHLARLTELEYLLVDRRGTRFAYELLYDGDGSTAVHLSGLIDVQELSAHSYDGDRSGGNADRSPPGRPSVGGRSGRGRGSKTAKKHNGTSACADSAAQTPEPRLLGGAAPVSSYLHAPAAASSPLAAPLTAGE